MDSSQPYTLLNTNNNFYCLPIACYITEINYTVNYSGYVHLHLTNTGNYVTSALTGSLAENSTYSPAMINQGFLINFQTSPNRFGGTNRFKPLEIFWETLPTTGDGDLKVILYYIKEKI